MVRYGRCMSKQSAKGLLETGVLVDDGPSSLVPVFDCPRVVEERLNSMSNDSIRNYFRHIGVRHADTVVLFSIDSHVDGIVGPIPQTNGLAEYKIPAGTPVEVYRRIRV